MANKSPSERLVDQFGFFPLKWTIEFDGGKISPVPKFDKSRKWIEKYLHEDGFLYPPTGQTCRFDLETGKKIERVPNTKRPILLHWVPASHELYLSCAGTKETLRDGAAAFIIHSLAYLFEIRLQFHDWWFDGRIPIGQALKVTSSPTKASDFLSHAYRVWNMWPQDEQKRFTNILYMRSRAPSYEWDWERFMIEYTVLDGCWKMAEKLGLSGLGQKKRPKHEDRIKILCERFSIPFQKSHLETITRLRNDLFHETLWSKGRPCSSRDASAFRMPFELRRLSKNLIPALLEYKN